MVLVETEVQCMINVTFIGSIINNRLICKGINLTTSRRGRRQSVSGDQLHKNP